MTASPLRPPAILWNSVPRVSVLDADPELFASVPEAQQTLAGRASAARLLFRRPGRWHEPAGDGFGLLVLDGLVLRRTGWGDRFSAELLGPGDLIRPWEEPADLLGALQVHGECAALSATRLAALDDAWAARMAPWPGVGTALTGRAILRSRNTAELMAIAQVRQLELRVWILLWCFAQRFGRVHRDGVHVELPLTHSQLAELASSRRPSLSAAVSRLTHAGHVRRRGRTWIVAGPPPGAPVSEHADV